MEAKFRLAQIPEDHVQQIEDRIDQLDGDGLISGYDSEQQMVDTTMILAGREIQTLQITFPVDELPAALTREVFN